MMLFGDCREQLKTLADNSVDSIVTDPPYEIAFMGKGWDNAGVAYDPATWAECLRVLKPGGHLLAFGATRTYHRMTVAIEDAGFEIRDSIHWIYGSGFPKSKNLDGDLSGWGTALKPAHEPIVVARKPLVGTVAGNVLARGTGALNIDGCRVGGNVWEPNAAGRWPANVIFDEAAAAELDAQSGDRSSPWVGNKKGNTVGRKGGKTFGDGAENDPSLAKVEYSDSGGASRFFYCAKAGAKERPVGPDGTKHPTVKPVALMRWLVRLVTPPGGTVLDPFAGSGATIEAAVLEEFKWIACELTPEYLPLIVERIRRSS